MIVNLYVDVWFWANYVDIWFWTYYVDIWLLSEKKIETMWRTNFEEILKLNLKIEIIFEEIWKMLIGSNWRIVNFEHEIRKNINYSFEEILRLK